MSVYKTNVALSIKGDRIERGREVELTAEEAAALDPNDITLVSSIPAPEGEDDLSDTPLEEMSHGQLKDRAKKLGLSASGSKADLQERIALHVPAPKGGDDITND